MIALNPLRFALILPLLAAMAAPALSKQQAPAPQPVVITGIGYAPISSQPAPTDEARRLLAIRASQLAAMRNIAEQVNGISMQGATAVSASAVRSDSIRATVAGKVAGARIVKITPKGDDTYETVMELVSSPQPGARR